MAPIGLIVPMREQLWYRNPQQASRYLELYLLHVPVRQLYHLKSNLLFPVVRK